MGKLDQGRKDLLDSLETELHDLASMHPPLEKDIQRILDLVRTMAYEPVDPLVLKDEIGALSNAAEALELQSRAETLIRNTFITQVSRLQLTHVQIGWIATCLLTTHLGVPWAVSIPSFSVAAGLSAGFMNLRWKSIQDQFIAQVALRQKTLTRNVSVRDYQR